MNQVTPKSIDLAAVKQKQQATWAAGDYALIGTTIQVVGELLCESADLRAGMTVLDVAAGNGNASLAAAHRFCDVTSTDYVPALVSRAEERATAERLDIKFRVEDAENLSFADNSFDAVISSFGVMFVADHHRAASEMVRVCKPGGIIAMANWTPDGFIGQVFKVLGAHLAPAPGVRSPALWGTEPALMEYFGDDVQWIDLIPRQYAFRYRSADHFIDHFRTFYGPIHKAYEALGDKAADLDADLRALVDRSNTADDGTLVVPSDYVDVVIRTKNWVC